MMHFLLLEGFKVLTVGFEVGLILTLVSVNLSLVQRRRAWKSPFEVVESVPFHQTWRRT